MIIARRCVLSISLLAWAAGCSAEDELGYDPAKLEAPDDVGGIPDDAIPDGHSVDAAGRRYR